MPRVCVTKESVMSLIIEAPSTGGRRKLTMEHHGVLRRRAWRCTDDPADGVA
jgi:hypothetical protein